MADDGSLHDDQGLNESQQRRLTVTCRYIDGLLGEVEVILTAAASRSPFGKYVDDVTPAQKKLITDNIDRVRKQMVRALAAARIPVPQRGIAALWAIKTSLQFVDVAIEELRPHYMEGYGAVAPGAASLLTGVVEGLQTAVRQLDASLAKGAAGDFGARLDRLAKVGAEREALEVLHDIIDRHSLVEFNRPLGMILDRLEDPRFEIAVFGRVSTGKSSLLDQILETTVLPIGVNPITGIPTRMVYGSKPRIVVSFTDAAAQTLPVERLPEFATEERNPANARHVTRLIVELPSAVLQAGVVFVDTPGLGSLATSGAAETLAYLPRCDLGVVLVDGTSSLSSEDIATISLLNQAAIPVLVVVSKADLLSDADQRRVVEYASGQIERQLAWRASVAAVSSVPSHRELLDAWLGRELWPRVSDHQAEVRVSIKRKIGALRESVEHALRSNLSRGQASPDRASLESLERKLRSASAAFEETRQHCEGVSEHLCAFAETVIKIAATRLADQQPAGDAVAVLRANVEATATEHATNVRQALMSLARHLAEAAREVAEGLRLPPPASDLSDADVFRELPRPELAALGGIHVSKLGRLLGKRVAAHQIARALTSAAG
ncbi:MAG TPA: dynamin family protein, partial [Vicinamibacterales bacterium]|nr:dynamin family protein [Vicinamibacterales bacterium]